ncbi:arginine deiminase type-3 [Westerdykella ornata]|uniref:Arginine deiminase type-3 n=1 Tax=Westerdykella ornata TaxID=318751 RepID=A0A6A6JL93_WESOR|nr:arginine deiminase type-3 [Westerdykella ornata]KAF2276995.1 arginine deiminase type-3 [Westerdykella ornata]
MRPQALLVFSGLCFTHSALTRAIVRESCTPSAPFVADIRADTNRDGKVDIVGSSDCDGKNEWTANSGAIFLPNIGDTDRRCSNALLNGPSVSNEELDDCNDASDNTMRSEQFLAPLLTVPIPELPDDTLGRVSIKDPVQRKNVRIFHKANANGTWVFVEGNSTFNAAALREGLVLGIDGRDTRRPDGWDGRVTVSFDVESSKGSSSDAVMLRVAPVLTHSHLDAVQQVLAVQGNETSAPWLLRFTKDLQSAVTMSGLQEAVYLFSGSDDIWAQDFMEPGFASMPGPDGPITLRVMIRSPQDERVAGRQLFEYYRGTGIGAVQQLGGSRHEINSGGNIETIPPYEFNGTSWPAGRIILGNHGEQKHFMLPFFQAQETQEPLLLDTDWLAIGHVDEFLQFMPANSSRGWVIMADDSMAGVQLLQQLKDSRHGSERAFSRKNNTELFSDCNGPSCAAIPVKPTTIDDLLADEDLMSVQKRCAERIEANLQILKDATGVTEAEIIRLPAMFSFPDIDFPGGNFSINATNALSELGLEYGSGELKVGALFPGVINGLVMTGFNTYIAPNPWGPIVNGTDILAEKLKSLYASINMNVIFVDDWNTHHNYLGSGYGGEVHCGTNSVRDMDRKWY